MLCFCLVGCSTAELVTQYYKDGEVVKTVSEFDKSVETKMEVAYLKNQRIKIGAFHNTKSKEEIVLIAEIVGAYSIDTKDSLLFNIDGKVIALSSIDQLTDVHRGSLSSRNPSEINNYSSRRYLVSKAFLKSLVESENVIIKINLKKEYVEDSLSEIPSRSIKSARSGLSDFYKSLQSEVTLSTK